MFECRAEPHICAHSDWVVRPGSLGRGLKKLVETAAKEGSGVSAERVETL